MRTAASALALWTPQISAMAVMGRHKLNQFMTRLVLSSMVAAYLAGAVVVAMVGGTEEHDTHKRSEIIDSRATKE